MLTIKLFNPHHDLSTTSRPIPAASAAEAERLYQAYHPVLGWDKAGYSYSGGKSAGGFPITCTVGA